MPIAFKCPHCGAQTSVADQFAGQTGPCASCGQAITVPPAVGYAGGPGLPPPKKSSAPMVLLIVAIVVIGGMCVVGGAVALLLPAVQAAREAALRTQCMNNLKQIGLALHNYADAHGTFPPAYIADASGKPMHSWRVLILPYLEYQNVYNQYDFNEPWDGPNNSRLASLMPPVYSCPSHPPDGTNTTSYMVVAGPGTAFPGATASRFADITDGLSNTVAVVESTGSTNWMAPEDLDFTTMSFVINDPAGKAISSDHPGGAVVLFADGSVRYVNDSLDPKTIKEMITSSGGEAPSNF